MGADGFTFTYGRTAATQKVSLWRCPQSTEIGVHRDSEHRIVSATIPIHAACGLSATEFMRQLCKGNAPQPQPKAEFWQLMDTLYEVHAAFKKCVPYYPNAAETCQEIEKFILELQQTATSPQRFDVEELIKNEVV